MIFLDSVAACLRGYGGSDRRVRVDREGGSFSGAELHRAGVVEFAARDRDRRAARLWPFAGNHTRHRRRRRAVGEAVVAAGAEARYPAHAGHGRGCRLRFADRAVAELALVVPAP